MKPTKWMRTAGPGSGLPVMASLVCALGFLMGGCKKQAPAPLPPPVVQVAEVTSTNVSMHTEIIGQLDSPQNVQIRARVEAFVQEVLFTEGTNVAEGTLLFKLDDQPFRERLKAAKGLLAEAEATLNKYRKDVDRLRPLAEKRAVPQQDLDNALAAVEVGKASVESAKARVDSMQLDVDYCTVRAPITGLIGAKQVSVGELVGKGEPTLLATMSTLDRIWFYCAVSEVQYLKAEAEVRRTKKAISELPVSLILADGTVHPAQGRFVFIDRAVDVKTGTLRIRAQFENTGGLLRPGMFGRIRIDLGTRADSIVVPERAVTELQGRTFVWVVTPENKASQRAVKLGETVPGGVLVLEGLKAGERIVTEGTQKVREGAPVQALTAAEAAAAAETRARAAAHGPEASKSAKE